MFPVLYMRNTHRIQHAWFAIGHAAYALPVTADPEQGQPSRYPRLLQGTEAFKTGKAGLAGTYKS